MLIIGLGNPGSEYRNTRHNVGFMVVDAICSEYGFSWQNNSKMMCELATGFIDSQKIIIIKPTTFMNISGQAASLVKNYYRIETSQILALHDDLDLPCAEIRYKVGGGSGGHNGIKSLDSTIGNMYGRIRIGIDKPPDKDMVSDYVLSNFINAETKILGPKIDLITQNIGLLLKGNIEEFKAKLKK